MENKPRRRARKPQAEILTADVNVTPVAVVDRQSALIDEKISQIISLQNGLSANERMLDELNVKINCFIVLKVSMIASAVLSLILGI